MNTEQEVRWQFLDEAQEYIDTIEAGVLDISQGFDGEKWDGVLRAAHSIKGGAAMMGYSSLSSVSHRLEDFFKIIQANRADSVNTEIEALLLQGVDYLREITQFCRQDIEVTQEWLILSLGKIFERLKAHLGELDLREQIHLLAEETGEDIAIFLFETEVDSCLERLENVLGEGTNPCLRSEFELVAQELGELAEILELTNFKALCQSIQEHLSNSSEEELLTIATLALGEWRRSQALILIHQRDSIPTYLPVESDLEPENLDFLNAISETSLATAEVSLNLTQIPEIMITDSGNAENIVRVSNRQLGELGDLIGELTIDRNGLNLQISSLRHLVNLLAQRINRLQQSNQELRRLYDREQIETLAQPRALNRLFDRLEMDRYSSSHLLFQELMEKIVQIQEVSEDIDFNLNGTERSARQVTRTSQLLQNQLTQIRMRPFSDLAGRFTRFVREMGLKYDKLVDLKISGGNTLIDRTILDALSDPLLHLIRNAFDHGIETPTTRSMLGKSPTGAIELSATYRGNQTIITLRDDGAGINTEKIRAKALEMGLTPGSETDLLNLIFEPGFSTAAQITDLSGRGVGMDIVRTKVQQVSGKISLNTQPGQGTTFIISVPFTLSVLRVLLVESSGMMLAFPTTVVEEMLIPTPEMMLLSAGQQFLNLEGYLLPLMNLKDWMHFSRPAPKPDTNGIPIINQPIALIVSHGSELVALEVDAYWGEQEVTLRNIDGFFPLPEGFSNCTILGDGRIVPLVDAYAIVEAMKLEAPDAPLAATILATPTLSPEQKPVIMVVDDSINVRRFLALTLEKSGYRNRLRMARRRWKNSRMV